MTNAQEQQQPSGFLEVGINKLGEVVINLDHDRTGHITFSPTQARMLADVLVRKAAAAEQVAPREGVPVGEYVADELRTRGWTTAYAATLMPGNRDENELWLDLLCAVALCEDYDIDFSEHEAKRLEELFGISSQTWLNLHKAYMDTKSAKGGEC